jgi:hypothetical protein
MADTIIPAWATLCEPCSYVAQDVPGTRVRAGDVLVTAGQHKGLLRIPLTLDEIRVLRPLRDTFVQIGVGRDFVKYVLGRTERYGRRRDGTFRRVLYILRRPTPSAVTPIVAASDDEAIRELLAAAGWRQLKEDDIDWLVRDMVRRHVEIFQADVFNAARARYPAYWTQSPRFTKAVRRALHLYGEDVEAEEEDRHRSGNLDPVHLRMEAVWEYLDRLYLADPVAQEHARRAIEARRAAQHEKPKLTLSTVGGHRICERGIHAPEWLDSSGHRILVAVDSRGRAVHTCRLFRRDTVDDVAMMMWRMLDREDPVTKGGAQ